MTKGAALILSFGLALGLGAQDSDKVGKDKAPTVAKKSTAEVQKKKSAVIAVATEVKLGPQAVNSTFEGVLRKEFAGVKGSADVFAKGSVYLVKVGDRYDSPDTLKGQEAVPALSFKNPAVMLSEAGRLAPGATYLSDDKVDGTDCKVLSLVADPVLLKEHLKEVGAIVQKTLKGFAGDLFSGNLASIFDEKTSVSRYALWVGKSDLLVHKLEWAMKPDVKPGSLPPQAPQVSVELHSEVKFTKWDEDVAFEIPAAVKAKWGIK